MLYHIVIKSKSPADQKIMAWNLDQNQLDSRVLDPHRFATPITLQGTTLSAVEWGSIRIWATPDSQKLSRSDIGMLGADSPVFFPFVAEDTDELINQQPGWGRVGQNLDAFASLSLPNDRDIFVVHGRNYRAKEAMFDFLEALGLHPLEWTEAVTATGKSTPYIGEILDAAFAKAGAVVVLLTPDDEARLRNQYVNENEQSDESRLIGQARPNVLFEAGMAMARSQEKTILAARPRNTTGESVGV